MNLKRVFVALIIALAVIILAAALCIRFGVLHRAKARRSRCVENLEILQLCKVTWMEDYHKTLNDTPTWDDLKDCLERHGVTNKPICPQGGDYTLGRVGDAPQCSIGGPEHTLPRASFFAPQN
jgi:hypothetical protein